MHIYNKKSNVIYIFNKINNIITKNVFVINKKRISATKVSSKIYKPKTYKKVINDLIHSKYQNKTFKKKI